MSINNDVVEKEESYIDSGIENESNLIVDVSKKDSIKDYTESKDSKLISFDKLKTLESLLMSIKKKSQTVKKQSEQLKLFNKKMEILFECIDVYSFNNTDENTISKADDIQPASLKRTEMYVKQEASNTHLNNSIGEKKIKIAENIKDVEKPVEFTEVIDEMFKSDRVNKSIAMSIYEMIVAKEKVPLDDIVRSFKYSKYKVIEIINSLIKSKIIVKSFDKGFIYRINK